MTPEQVAALTPAQVRALTPSQIKDFHPDVAKALTAEQHAMLSVKQRMALAQVAPPQAPAEGTTTVVEGTKPSEPAAPAPEPPVPATPADPSLIGTQVKVYVDTSVRPLVAFITDSLPGNRVNVGGFRGNGQTFQETHVPLVKSTDEKPEGIYAVAV